MKNKTLKMTAADFKAMNKGKKASDGSFIPKVRVSINGKESEVIAYSNGALIPIKPLSVNEAWKGMRFKTPAYETYELALLSMLPFIYIPSGKLEIHFKFGFSNSGSDLDNPVKLCQDILQKKYKFNDSRIYGLTVEKEVVKKGCEYFSFSVLRYAR